MAIRRGLVWIVLVGSVACSAHGPELGYLPLKGADQASVDALIVDGMTTKDQLNRHMGAYFDRQNPAMVENMRCKPEARYCIYNYLLSDAYYKSVEVHFDTNNVVTSHKLTVRPVQD